MLLCTIYASFPRLWSFKTFGPQSLTNYAHPYLPPGIAFPFSLKFYDGEFGRLLRESDPSSLIVEEDYGFVVFCLTFFTVCYYCNCLTPFWLMLFTCRAFK
jgi:hypothetical protein